MLNALVVDDEQLTAELIARFLELTGRVKVSKIITNPLQVIDEIGQNKPEVVFLDIEMPEINGLELAKKIMLMQDQPDVVFITAYDNYALKAFKVNALDYILKPLDPVELERVVAKICQKRPQVHKDSDLEIKALGGFSVVSTAKQEPIKWKTSKCEELFAYLVFKRDTSITKWQLIDLLWPEKDERKSEINLRSTVYRINKTLQEHGVSGRIVAFNNGYRLDIKGMKVDALQLEKAIMDWRNGESKDLLTLQELRKIYPGHLFEGLDYLWAEWLRTYYMRLFVDWGKEIVNLRLKECGDIKITYQMLEYIIGQDSFNEDLRSLALEILYMKDGIKAVMEYYWALNSYFMENIGIEPGEKIKELYAGLLVKSAKI